MNVVELHPEDLIDKLAAGQLTRAESERLDTHLAQCASCRFEVGVRADLSQEAPRLVERPQVWFSEAAGGTQLIPPHAGRFQPVETEVESRAAASRSRRRWPQMVVAVGLLLCAGGAAAAVLSGAIEPPWRRAPAPPNVTTPSRARATLQRPKTALAKPAVVEPVQPSPAPAAPAAAVGLAPAGMPERALPVREPRSRRPPRSRGSNPAAIAQSDAAESIGSDALPSSPAPALEDPAAILFTDANRARRDGNADRAVTLYRSLQARFPKSSESNLSRALLAQLLLERGNPDAALAGFDHYLAESTPVLAAEACVGRARALEQLGKNSQAVAAWRQVQRLYPGSVHARLAATRLAALGSR